MKAVNRSTPVNKLAIQCWVVVSGCGAIGLQVLGLYWLSQLT